MNSKDLKELKRRSVIATQMLKEGKELPEHDFSSIPGWKDIIHKVIAEMLGYRLRNGITQNELAAKMGIKQSLISRYEHAGRNPSIEFLYKVAEGLELQLFITPFGDRTVVLSPEQKETLERFVSDDKPDFKTVLNHAIEFYDSIFSTEIIVSDVANTETSITYITMPAQQEYNPYQMAAKAFNN